MNALLEQILQTKLVSDGTAQIPLHSYMTEERGALIDRVFRSIKPDVSLETGFAYGVSTLFVCDALAANDKPATHIVIDPWERSYWRGIGLNNIKRAGYEQFIEFREERSEIALPSLLGQGTRIQAAIIDGNHTFDHALVDFFYVNKMLTIGGAVIIDDTDYPSVSRLVEHVLTYPAYQVFATTPRPQLKAPGRVRKALAQWTLSPRLRRAWDYPGCMAFRKLAEDDRDWDWHTDF